MGALRRSGGRVAPDDAPGDAIEAVPDLVHCNLFAGFNVKSIITERIFCVKAEKRLHDK